MAFSAAGIIVAVIFLIWLSAFIARLNTPEETETAVAANAKPTLVESLKRKATLLFGAFELPKLRHPIEYKQEESSTTKEEKPATSASLEARAGIATSTEDESFDDLVKEMFRAEFEADQGN